MASLGFDPASEAGGRAGAAVPAARPAARPRLSPRSRAAIWLTLASWLSNFVLLMLGTAQFASGGNYRSEQRIAELQSLVATPRAGMREADVRPRHQTEYWLRHGNDSVRVPVDAITHVGSEDEYVRLYTAAGSRLMRGSIRQIVTRLDPSRFVRVHRKWLVRRDAIAAVRRTGLGRAEVVLTGGEKLPAGRGYARALREPSRGG